MEEKQYKILRNEYLPKHLKIIFILESPPISEKYFYKPNGRVTEPLFSAMMRIINFKPVNKAEGLIKFMNYGFFIVDATYEPINRMTSSQRKSKILSNVENLIKDLKFVIKNKKVKIIIVKANVCRLLEKLLKAEFNIINKGIIIPFPSNGHQNEFYSRIKRLI